MPRERGPWGCTSLKTPTAAGWRFCRTRPSSRLRAAWMCWTPWRVAAACAAIPASRFRKRCSTAFWRRDCARRRDARGGRGNSSSCATGLCWMIWPNAANRAQACSPEPTRPSSSWPTRHSPTPGWRTAPSSWRTCSWRQQPRVWAAAGFRAVCAKRPMDDQPHEFVANLLKVPAPYQLEAILSLGMPEAEAPRRPFDEALLEKVHQGDVLEIQFHSLPCQDRRFGTAAERGGGEIGDLVPREEKILAKSRDLVPFRGKIRGLVPALGRISRFGTREGRSRASRPGVSPGPGNQIAEVDRNRDTKPRLSPKFGLKTDHGVPNLKFCQRRSLRPKRSTSTRKPK